MMYVDIIIPIYIDIIYICNCMYGIFIMGSMLMFMLLIINYILRNSSYGK